VRWGKNGSAAGETGTSSKQTKLRSQIGSQITLISDHTPRSHLQELEPLFVVLVEVVDRQQRLVLHAALKDGALAGVHVRLGSVGGWLVVRWVWLVVNCPFLPTHRPSSKSQIRTHRYGLPLPIQARHPARRRPHAPEVPPATAAAAAAAAARYCQRRACRRRGPVVAAWKPGGRALGRGDEGRQELGWRVEAAADRGPQIYKGCQGGGRLQLRGQVVDPAGESGVGWEE
jgi:hypothetical protein